MLLFLSCETNMLLRAHDKQAWLVRNGV